jgi:hypothetical protein
MHVLLNVFMFSVPLFPATFLCSLFYEMLGYDKNDSNYSLHVAMKSLRVQMIVSFEFLYCCLNLSNTSSYC